MGLGVGAGDDLGAGENAGGNGFLICLSGGFLKCRTSLDPCPKNHSPQHCFTYASNSLKSSPVSSQ